MGRGTTKRLVRWRAWLTPRCPILAAPSCPGGKCSVVREVVLCADLGTGSLRVGAISARGEAVATAVAPMRTANAGAIDPETWWRALGRTVGRTLDRLPKSDRVRGLYLTGLTRT